MHEHDLHDITELRKHDLVPDGTDESVNSVHPKSDGLEIRVLLQILIEPLFGRLPLLGDLVVNIDHVEEYHLEHLID